MSEINVGVKASFRTIEAAMSVVYTIGNTIPNHSSASLLFRCKHITISTSKKTQRPALGPIMEYSKLLHITSKSWIGKWRPVWESPTASGKMSESKI